MVNNNVTFNRKRNIFGIDFERFYKTKKKTIGNNIDSLLLTLLNQTALM